MAIQTMRAKKAPDALTAVFGALANPTRRAILDQLATGVYSVSELAAPFKMRQPSISKHLKVLENAGLVERGKDAQWRPRALELAPFEEANAYLGKFRTLMEDRLELCLEKLKAAQAAINASIGL